MSRPKPPILRDAHISRQSRFDVRCPSIGRSCKHGAHSPGLSRKKLPAAGQAAGSFRSQGRGQSLITSLNFACSLTFVVSSARREVSPIRITPTRRFLSKVYFSYCLRRMSVVSTVL